MRRRKYKKVSTWKHASVLHHGESTLRRGQTIPFLNILTHCEIEHQPFGTRAVGNNIKGRDTKDLQQCGTKSLTPSRWVQSPFHIPCGLSWTIHHYSCTDHSKRLSEQYLFNPKVFVGNLNRLSLRVPTTQLHDEQDIEPLLTLLTTANYLGPAGALAFTLDSPP